MSYRRSCQEKLKLKRLYNETKNGYRSGAFYNERKQRIVRFNATNTPGYRKYLRRLSNKRLRHYKNLPLNHSSYKKLFDYWWILF